MNFDQELLQAALVGLEMKKAKLDDQIASVRSMIAGKTETIIIAKMTNVKLSLMMGIPPKKYPRNRNDVIQAMPPTTLKDANFAYVIVPMPSTNGANVLTIGINLA